MNRSSASPSSDSSNTSEMYAALYGYNDYADTTVDQLNFVCYCNESALIMSSEQSDNPGKIVATCRNYHKTAYGCNMWEWFDNDVLREDWIADMNERNHFRIVNNTTTDLPFSMYKGRRTEGRPVCVCDRPCILLALGGRQRGGSAFYYVCQRYYEPNGEKCCMKLLYDEKEKPNWAGVLVVKLKTALDEELEEHKQTKIVNEDLEEEVAVLGMKLLELKEK
ncbi:hypothetical protein ACFE04_023285 [Oxalis oulophora]